MTILYADRVLSADGWLKSARLHLVDGRIACIERNVPAQTNDERHAVIVPALANLHSHAFQRGIAGLTETRGPSGDDFWSWRETMYRFALRMSPDQLHAVAAQAYVEMLESGFGRVGEFHYLHHDLDGRSYADPGEMAGRIVAAAAATGIALTLLPVFYAHSSFGGQAPQPAQRRFVSDLDGYARLIERSRALVASLPGAIVGVAPHSLRAVTPTELKEIIELLPNAPVHIHVAEQLKEVNECLAWSGSTPVQWLLDHAPVDARWCLVHATHINERESNGIASSGAVAGLCPITEANLGDGLFPAAEYASAGGVFGIGTDSNVCISVRGELSLLEYSQRLSKRVRNVIGSDDRSTGAALFELALRGGAQALGAADVQIAAGNRADLVSLSVASPAMLSREEDALIDSWLFACASEIVDCVWVNGRKCVEGGHHHRRDQVRSAYDKALSELRA